MRMTGTGSVPDLASARVLAASSITALSTCGIAKTSAAKSATFARNRLAQVVYVEIRLVRTFCSAARVRAQCQSPFRRNFDESMRSAKSGEQGDPNGANRGQEALYVPGECSPKCPPNR